MSALQRRPGGWSRRLARAPLWLYRHRLGWLLGERFLCLVTLGRRTGLPRETVLEVVRRDSVSGAVWVVSGWGAGSDWFRNLEAAPAVEIRLGRRRISAPVHRVLSPDECLLLLVAYRHEHPLLWRMLAPLLGLPLALSATSAVDGIQAVRFAAR